MIRQVAWLVMFVLWVCASAPALAMFGQGGVDISAFCQTEAPRQTLLYLDTRIIGGHSTNWARQVFDKIVPSLLPSEPLTVLTLDSTRGVAHEVWKGCYPNYWPADYSKRKSARSGLYDKIFGKSFDRQLKEQQDTFKNQLNGALGKAMKAATADSDKVHILRALANDSARFSPRAGEVRMVLLSDLRDSSESLKVGSGSDPAASGRDAAKRLGADFNHADVYVYGIDQGPRHANGAQARIAAEAFTGFVKAAHGYIANIGTELLTPPKPPSACYTIPFDSSWLNNPLSGRIVLFADDDGVLSDSYVLFRGQGSSSIMGTFQCLSDGVCRLEAKTEYATITTSRNEVLNLKGKLTEMTGKFGHPDAHDAKGRVPVIKLKGHAAPSAGCP